MVVTGLRPDVRSSGFVIVEVDGSRLASLPVEVVKGLGLAPGGELAPDREGALRAAAREEAARQVALRMLAVRPHSRGDLLRKLRDRGHEPGAAAAALGRLEAAGLLDDASYARHFVRVRAPRGHGPSRLVHDLLVRGVERVVAERAVAEISAADELDPSEAARTLARKRMAALGSVAPAVRRRRVLAYLARRGFRGREIRDMVTVLLDGQRGKGNDGDTGR